MEQIHQTWVKVKLWLTIAACLGLLLAMGFIYQQSRTAAMPHEPAATTEIDPIARELTSMTTRQKIASLLMLHVSGTAADKIVDFVTANQPGGLILMSDNIHSDLTELTTLTAAIQAAAKPFPIFIAIDEEGCKVKRLPQDDYACAKDLGKGSTEATEQTFLKRSQLLDSAGINLNFGIVADITGNPDSFIYPRVFGADPKQVSGHVTAAVQGSSGIVLSTVKHFPGHGLTDADSHKTIPVSDISKSVWRKEVSPPFEAAIKSNVDAVMFSHLVYQEIDNKPASLSPAWHAILDQELGFKGLMVTDDLIMLKQSGEAAYQDASANVIASILAGNTISLMVNDHRIAEQPHTIINIEQLLDEVTAAVDSGQISRSHLDNLVYKSLQFRSTLP